MSVLLKPGEKIIVTCPSDPRPRLRLIAEVREVPEGYLIICVPRKDRPPSERRWGKSKRPEHL